MEGGSPSLDIPAGLHAHQLREGLGRVGVWGAYPIAHGLLFYRWIQLRVAEATKERVPIGQLAGRLDKIQVVAMTRPGSKKVKVVLQKLDTKQKSIVKALGLARYVPN